MRNDNVDLGEIVFCNMTLRNNKGVELIVNELIFSHPYDNKRLKFELKNRNDVGLIKRLKQESDLDILKIEVIKRLGFKHKGSNYTKVKKSNENRNNITGAYE